MTARRRALFGMLDRIGHRLRGHRQLLATGRLDGDTPGRELVVCSCGVVWLIR